nr:RNA-directed DNA polymerase, eukaryota, reverse transcriptase zinc-binding domain protein [Tanacetum cinerariifolium]
MGVGSWFSVLKQASFDFIPEGRIEEEGFHSKRLCIYSKSDDSDDDNESDNGFKDGDAKVQDGAGREEVPLGGSSFTWCHKSATKMSKLDRFLISENLMISCLNISAISLDRYLSDQRPILLRESQHDYGPIPFWFFNHWLEQDGFNKFVIDMWNLAPIDEINAMRNVMIKLKFLKRKIQELLNDNRNKSKSVSDQLKEELQKLDADIDKGIESDDIINKRLEVLKSIQHLDKIKAMDVAQKPKIKWAIKGDENTRPISLIESMYKIIAKILANHLVGVLRDIVNGVQSAFIMERQILDGPFILNEVIQWYKLKKKQSLILEVDFEKSYDSVRWDFLDDVLKKFGFGNKWCAWIQSCLRSSRGSIIINGSPVKEFQFFKGIKQGDPLPPFLFILIMKSLHLSFQRVVDVGMFKRINLSPLVNLSHMFNADDEVFVGQWYDGNINTQCFFQASGLHINMCKSKIMRVNVGDEKVKSAASKLGCLILNTPFSYLGTKVFGNMSRVQAWTEVFNKCNQQGDSDSGYYVIRWILNVRFCEFSSASLSDNSTYRMPWTYRRQLVENDINQTMEQWHTMCPV